MKSPDKRADRAPPHTDRDNAALQARLRARYRQAVHSLDPATGARLNAARLAAIRGGTAPGRWLGDTLRRQLLPAGAFAVLALATLVIWRPLWSGGPQPQAATAATDADSALPPDPDSADPALYQNLEFYDWLAANDTGKASGRP